MKPSAYFHDRVKMFLGYLPNKALNAGIDVVSIIIVYDMAMPYVADDYANALEAWLQGRYDIWRNRIDAYKTNPTAESLAVIAELAIREHTPHTRSDYDDIVERAYRLAINETLIENEIEKRKNNGE